MWRYLRDPTFSRFDTIPECDGHTHTHTHTHRRTDRHTTTAYTALSKASRGKNACPSSSLIGLRQRLDFRLLYGHGDRPTCNAIWLSLNNHPHFLYDMLVEITFFCNLQIDTATVPWPHARRDVCSVSDVEVKKKQVSLWWPYRNVQRQFRVQQYPPCRLCTDETGWIMTSPTVYSLWTVWL